MKQKKKYIQAEIDFTGSITAKVPPQSKELEEAVPGAIMLEKGAFDKVIEILKPECFYVASNQGIYKAVSNPAQKSHRKQPDHLQKDETVKMRFGVFELMLINPGKKAMVFVAVAMLFSLVITTLIFLLHYYFG
jgi:DnaB-like helicase N terminal domain